MLTLSDSSLRLSSRAPCPESSDGLDFVVRLSYNSISAFPSTHERGNDVEGKDFGRGPWLMQTQRHRSLMLVVWVAERSDCVTQRGRVRVVERTCKGG